MFLDTDRDPTFDEGLHFILMDMTKRKLYSATFYSAKVFFSYEPYSFSQKRLFCEKRAISDQNYPEFLAQVIFFL